MSRSVLWRVTAVALLLAIGGPSTAQTDSVTSGIAARLAQRPVWDEVPVRQFYQHRDFAPAWGGSAAADTNARQVLTAMSHAGEDGLDPVRYRVSAPGDPAAYDIAITTALLNFMRDLASGRPELKGLDPDVALPPASFDAARALEEALRANDLGAMFAGLAPSDPGYAHLKSALARYRAIAAQGGWSVLSAAPEAEFYGAMAPLLWRRLADEDGGLAATPQIADLPMAVKAFQSRHGLAPDGVVGPLTLAALNMPASGRADTIAANMERWRWLPRVLEPDRIVINVADAQLEMWLGGQRLLTSRVIVGRPHDPTPILRAEGAGITVNPPWTVPASIAAREILPKLKSNHAYLASQDMILIDGPPGDPQGLHVNWRAVRAGTFPYRIRQYPGPRNPLGRVKLELPNQFDVYLHDTPGKAAFARGTRDLSHGCVRVEQILPLASYALAADLSATDMIVQAIGAGDTKYLPLRKKLPVYFLYWTAFAGVDGAPEFRPDIYGRDQRLIAALGARPQQFATVMPNCRKA